uniref:Syntaxin-18 n=1 Tax=Panstrongylus megistus TaxID=65343 RepID=A0A069DRX9_9HEMI
MDITTLFRACVKDKKAQNKELAMTGGNNSIFPTSRKCEFVTRFKDLLKQISQLKDFLLEHRKSYLNLTPIFIESDNMSDYERENIDREAQHIIKSCSQLIQSYKRDLYGFEENNQKIENHKAIIDLLETYLKTVCKIYTEQKAIRVKWTVEVKKLSKLESEPKKEDEFTKMAHNKELSSKLQDNKEEVEENSVNTKTIPFYSSANDDENVLSEEELQMFEMENQQLYNELNSLNDEVRNIQSKVVKIAQLQEVFTEKVLQQNEEIERISTTLVGTTENLKDANTQIRQAIQSNASLRIYILFFLIVMSFSLLFLDWYND